MQDLIIKHTGDVKISHNLNDIKQYAMSLVEKYNNVVITENQIVEIKFEIANINKSSKAINDERIRIAKLIKAPADNLKAEADDIIAILNNSVSGLKLQLDEFENNRIEKRRTHVNYEIENSLAAYELDSIDFDDRWLNKSMTITKIKEQINIICQREVERIDNEIAVSKAKKEKADFVEKTNNELAAQYGFFMPVNMFLNIDMPISEIRDFIEKQYFNDEIYRKRGNRAGESDVVGANKEASSTNKQVWFDIQMSYKRTDEEKIKLLFKEIKSLCRMFEISEAIETELKG